jgi:preprotein translocase subunit SecG
MLSFLKEGQLKPLGGEPSLPAIDGQGAGNGQSDYLTVAGHGKKLKQSTTLLIIVFVVGTAGVWMMIRKAAPSQAAAAQKKNDMAEIESAVAQLNGMQSEVNNQMKSVTTRLNHLSQVGQVGVEDLRKNPFVIDVLTQAANTSDPAQKQILESQLRQKAAALELWTVSESPRGTSCMINDKVLYAGDEIEGFRIKEIRAKSVIVEQNNIQAELKID